MRAISVFVGGASGTLARWWMGLALAGPSTRFPWATLAVNLSGAFGLGLAAALLTERFPPRPHLRTLLGIGFFGAYTTFSTMAVEGVRLVEAGRPETAALYWVVTLVAGQMAGVYGMWLGRLELPRGGGGDEARG